MYERQHLRELEALRTDVSHADKKHIPAKPVVAPRPAFIPPLEDFSRPPAPQPGPPSSSGTPVPRHASIAPLAPSGTLTPANVLLPSSPLPPSSPAPPTPRQQTSGISSSSASNSPLLPQSPGAGPSSPVPPMSAQSATFAPSVQDGPPLGGRFVDGTKSMFVKHTPSSLAPTGLPAASSFNPNPFTPSRQGFPSPLHSAGFNAPSPHPLSRSSSVMPSDPLSAGPVTPVSYNANGQAADLDPLGMAKPAAFMSQSMRVQPTRPRLDAREAASKLANMF